MSALIQRNRRPGRGQGQGTVRLDRWGQAHSVTMAATAAGGGITPDSRLPNSPEQGGWVTIAQDLHTLADWLPG